MVELRPLGLLHRLLGETLRLPPARWLIEQASAFRKSSAWDVLATLSGTSQKADFLQRFRLGMAAVVAERTGVTTISDFRSRDMVVGGHGAPLTALPDYLLFRDALESRALVHLGGLASLTYLPKGARLSQTLGFEIGPCNSLLDGLMSQLTGGREEFDQGGKHGVQGRCIEQLLQRWLSHPYLQRTVRPRAHRGKTSSKNLSHRACNWPAK